MFFFLVSSIGQFSLNFDCMNRMRFDGGGTAAAHDLLPSSRRPLIYYKFSVCGALSFVGLAFSSSFFCRLFARRYLAIWLFDEIFHFLLDCFASIAI